MKSCTLGRFWKLYAALPDEIRRDARKAYQKFIANPQHPGLHFHRLFADDRFWCVRVSRDYRAVGIVEGDTITWIWIGNHREFDRAFPR